MRWALAFMCSLFPMVAVAQAGKPSVLVTTEAARQGVLPRTLTAYGTIQAAPDGSETLSLLRGGQVLRVAVAPGQAVKQGQPLLAVNADPAALAAYRQAVAASALARGQRARTAQMLADRMATRDQLAQADNAVTAAQANLDLLNRAGGGGGEQTVAAPFDGVVASLLVAPGARVAAQAPLVTLARLDRLVAAVGIEPGRRGLVAPGQPVQLIRLDGDGSPLPGKVHSVGAMVDPQTRLVLVLVAASPANGGAAPPERQQADGAPATSPSSLLPGEPVRVILQVGEMRGWLVPRGAVLTDAKGAYLFQVDGAKAARIDVRVVGVDGGTTVVTGALDPARALVTRGSYQLQDGDAVRLANTGGAATQ